MELHKLKHRPAVAAAMTPFPYWVDEADPLAKVQQIMDEHEIRHVPVKRGEELVGVVTLRDLAVAIPQARDGRLRVRDMCLTQAYVVDLHEPLDRVAARMAELQVGSAIVTKDCRLCGIFTVVDACRLLGRIVAAYFAPPSSDQPA
jgi:acetoin utilization protein AcuB